MTPKLVSIVVPAFNEEKLIAKCLRSLKAQDYKGPVEIIVVDNNSTDNTAKIAREEGMTVVFEPTPGVCFAREAGTQAARGDIVIQTDADTTFPTDWLSQIMTAFSKNPDAVAVAGSFEFENAPWWGDYLAEFAFGLIRVIDKTTGRLIYVPGSNTAFKKDAWQGYNTKLDQGGDEVALLKQLKKQGKVVFLPRNTVLTSPRRLQKGLLYNIFVTFLFYYIVDYSVRRVTGKNIAAFPRIRKEKRKSKQPVI